MVVTQLDCTLSKSHPIKHTDYLEADERRLPGQQSSAFRAQIHMTYPTSHSSETPILETFSMLIGHPQYLQCKAFCNAHPSAATVTVAMVLAVSVAVAVNRHSSCVPNQQTGLSKTGAKFTT